MVDTRQNQDFIQASVERHRKAMEGDYQQLLKMQKDQFLAQVRTTQIKTLEENHEREIRELENKLRLQEEATNFERGRKSKLRSISMALATKHTHMETERLVVVLWREFVHARKHQRHMDVYCRNYYRRRTMRVTLKAWKEDANEHFRERMRELMQRTSQETTEKVRNECESELATLRHMVEELAEDLRKEALAKNAMRYKFENAILRGMNALSIENMTMQQEVMERGDAYIDREMSPISKNLVFNASAVGQEFSA